MLGEVAGGRAAECDVSVCCPRVLFIKFFSISCRRGLGSYVAGLYWDTKSYLSVTVNMIVAFCSYFLYDYYRRCHPMIKTENGQGLALALD